MKFCTIGCGGHAYQTHGPSQQLYAKLHSDVMLSACCDLNPKLAETYRDAYGFEKAYTDIGEMIEKEKPDAVALIVPAPVTRSLAVPLLESGIPLLLEKPPGLNVRDYEQLLAASKKGDGLHQVAFNRRYSPAMVQARKWLERDVSPEQVFNIRYDMVRHARNEQDFSITAVHAIDAALYLSRSPYREVNFIYRELPECGEGVVVFSMHAKCASGTEVSITFQPLSGMLDERVSIYGADRSFLVNLLGNRSAFDGNAVYWHQGDIVEGFEVKDKEIVRRMGVYGETEAFLEAVAGRGTAAPVLENCRQQVVLMEAIRNRQERVDFHELCKAVSMKVEAASF